MQNGTTNKLIMKKIVWLLKEYERGEHSPAVIFWYGILEKLGYEVVYYPYENYKAELFYNEMKEYKPDFIFHACYEVLHTEFARLREFTKVYVVQSDDDWRFESYAKCYIPLVDGTISYQADPNWYIAAGATTDQIIPAKWAFNPTTMMAPSSNNTKDIFISHGGSLYGDRITLINELNNKKMPVTVATQVAYGQLIDLWDRSKYSLCFTKSSQGGFRQKKGRIAEIAYHCVLASEPFPGIEDYYEPDKEFIIFETIDELLDKLAYYEKNQNEYNKILQAGRNRLWQTNTVFHQWDNIMQRIDQDYKQFNINKILQQYETSN